jgi:hypothetical protein
MSIKGSRPLGLVVGWLTWLLLAAVGGCALLGVVASPAIGDSSGAPVAAVGLAGDSQDAPPATAAEIANFAATAPGLSAFEAQHPLSNTGSANVPSSSSIPSLPSSLLGAASLPASTIAKYKSQVAAEGELPIAASTSQTDSNAASSSVSPATVLYPGGTYGIADAVGQFLSYYNQSYFTNLQAAEPIKDVRFFVPWDAFGTASGSSCVNNTSSTYTSAQLSAQDTLYFSLAAANIDKLDPLISLEGDPTVSGDPTAPTTETQYQCAIAGLLLAIHDTWGLGSLVHEYEFFNEPDAVSGLSAATAALYFEGFAWVEAFEGWTDFGIAGTFGDKAMNEGGDPGGSGTFVADYLTDIENDYYTLCATYSVCVYPGAVSGHAYDDVDDSYTSGSYSAGTRWLVSQVDHYLVGDPPVWITEAGVAQSLTTSTSGPNAVGCPSGPTHSDKDPNDNNAVSACVDDSAIHQATAAQGFLNLANVSGVERVYWYQFTQNYNWDSALVANDMLGGGDCAAGAIWPASGCTGQPRPAYCMLYWHSDGVTPATCAASATYNDTHTLAGSTYAYGHLSESGSSCIAGSGSESCCVIPASGGTPFNTINVTDDDWMDLEQGLPDPCFRQTGGQG